jgi:hypothetical protein
MKMVVHEDVSIEHNARHLDVMRQLGEEAPAVVVAMKDIGPAVATAGNVVQRVGEVNARRSRHGYSLTRRKADGKIIGEVRKRKT